jgi:hypothetical protein
MKFHLHAALDNAAFEDSCSGTEMARILRKLADKLEGYAMGDGDKGKLADFNGNSIGGWVVEH